MQRSCQLLLVFILISIGHAQQDNSYIQLQSGEKLYGKIVLSTPMNNGWFLTLNDTAQYSIIDIQSFQDSSGYYLRIDGRSKVAFRMQKGNMDLFTKHILDDESTNSFHLKSTHYFSINGQAAQIVNYDNLRRGLSNNPQSLACLNKCRISQYTQNTITVVTIGAIIAILASQGDNKNKLQNSLLSGVAGTWLSFMANSYQKKKLEEAIFEYNK